MIILISLYSASTPVGELSPIECAVNDIQAEVSISSGSDATTPRPKKTKGMYLLKTK